MNNPKTLNIFPFNPHVAPVCRALIAGEHNGPNGSVALAERHILPDAMKGNWKMWMLMVNVYYTVAGVLGSQGIYGKIRAAYYLKKAKDTAVKAILQETGGFNLTIALGNLDVHLGSNQASNIECGHVHLLMACFIKWHVNFTLRFKLNGSHNVVVIRKCNKIIQRSNETQLKMLALASLYELPETPQKEKEEIWGALYQFMSPHYNRLMMLDPRKASEEDLILVQTVCRICRALGNKISAADLAKLYRLGDQLQKAAH